MTEFVVPRLAVGDWGGTSGVGCVMNLMCWMKHPEDIHDEPEGWTGLLRDAVIGVNDYMCTHRTKEFIPNSRTSVVVELNCADCSSLILDLAFASENIPEGALPQRANALAHYLEFQYINQLEELPGPGNTFVSPGTYGSRYDGCVSVPIRVLAVELLDYCLDYKAEHPTTPQYQVPLEEALTHVRTETITKEEVNV